MNVDGCDLCGDVTEAMFLHARCHPTAPLRARKTGNVLILTCYLPDCGREVARLALAEPPVPRATEVKPGVFVSDTSGSIFRGGRR